MKKISAFVLLTIGFSAIFLSCTKHTPPDVTTDSISGITQTGAVSGGNVTNDGGADVISRGVCWSTSPDPTIAGKRTSDGTGTGTYNSTLTYLTPKTYYYLRAYATNSGGTGYGNQQEFSTPAVITGSVNDIDGNTYMTVMIGNQTWMAENLKTTKFNDNTSIPLVTNNTAWSSLTTPGYCWYNNDSSTYKSTYGALYNWYSVSTGKLCPSGWRIPSDAQWSVMSDYLGGEILAVNKLQEEGREHWIIPYSSATNESGFTALPGGGRVSGSFDYIGRAAAWWSSTEYDAGNAWCRELDDDIAELLRGSIAKSYGFSVRCIKNN
jgi:uncharacterized protein (TIGR02145 family)